MRPDIGCCLHRLASSFFILFIVASMSGAVAGEPPDLELNPVTGYLESVDVADDSSSRIRHLVDEGQGGRRTSELISSGAGWSPRIAITASGKSWVVWWEDSASDEVYCRTRSGEPGTWSAVRRVSSVGEEGRHPEIVHHNGTAWIAYEITGSGGTKSVAVLGTIDDPEPIPTRTVIATTLWNGDVDVLIHAEPSHVWATWVDSSTHLGWSEWSSATGLWQLPQYESYATDSVEQARSRIRDAVLGQ